MPTVPSRDCFRARIEFYCGDALFHEEEVFVLASRPAEAMTTCRMWAEQSPYFNPAIPDLGCVVRVLLPPFLAGAG